MHGRSTSRSPTAARSAARPVNRSRGTRLSHPALSAAAPNARPRRCRWPRRYPRPRRPRIPHSAAHRATAGARGDGAPRRRPEPSARYVRCSNAGRHRQAGRRRWPRPRHRSDGARPISGRRARGSTFVASTTVSRPRASRCRATVCSRLKAADVADWSASSSAIIARKASELRISVGRKWRRAKVDLPEPAGPTRTTRHGSGSSMRIGAA